MGEGTSLPDPTMKDKLKAAIAKAQEESDVPLASRIQIQLENKLTLERVKRRKKQERKPAIRQYPDSLDDSPKRMDPNSDQE